ncbi:MAG TPA: hypothetical protein VLH59_09825 [Ignavibacteriaceae bacterium]|nr:hypothetical protein [Ignavibacteriaceae bacterium]
MLKVYPEKVVDYLEKKSLKQWDFEWNEFSGIQAAIVIPAICEFENIQRVLLSLAQNEKSSLQKSIVILVINNSISSQQEVKDDNKSSLKFLRALMRGNPSDQLSNQIIQSGIKIGLIDAASEGKEFNDDEGGVGLARKIGMDTALRVFDYSTPGKKIIISLDADCVVEENYLSEISFFFRKENVSAATIDFEHNLSEEGINRLGIISYEIFLRHYVAGLLFAKSPYGYHNIGSTIVCDHEAYIKVGGMNTKKAAEDFYFLQKLAKHYTINRIGSTKVRPSARESWRVPFGTGRTMNDISSNKKNIFLYDADVYIILKDWLELLNSDLSLNPSLILKETKIIHPELYNFLESRGFSNDWEKILENSKSLKQLDYQRKNWFDAFETLKLIHHLRDTSFPMIDIDSGVEKLFKIVQHSVKFDLRNETNNTNSLYEFYLSELKLLEHTLYKTQYE